MSEIIVEIHECEQIADELLAFAVIMARYNGQWVFCRHKERDTYEIHGGHREPDENIDDTARRELTEESGAVRFSLTPVCVYSVIKENRTTYGKLFFVEISELGVLSPDYEIAEVYFFDDLPDSLTYPDIQPILYEKVQMWLNQTICFGMPTLIELKTPEACAALCRELGLSFVELNMNLPEYQADRLDAWRFLEVANRYGIYFTIHLDENLNPCDFNERVAAAYTETALSAIAAAKQLSVPVLNMHMAPGVHFKLPDRKIFLFEAYKSVYLRKLIAFRDACAEAAGGAGIKICVENCGDFGGKPYIQEGLALLLESPVFAVTFDIGHNAAADIKDEPIVLQYIDRLFHMHIHDAHVKKNHLPLGTGELDVAKYLDLAKTHNCRVVLEVKTVAGLRQSVAWLREKGYM